jgi:hypothetical protein
MAESSFTDPKVIEASKSFVNLIAHRETGHGEKETLVGREKMKLCTDYYTIPCETHTKAWSAVGKFFQGSFGTPTTVFADPAGTEIDRKVGSASGSELLKLMNAALAKVKGDKIHLTAWSLAKKGVTDGDALLEKKEYRKAVEAYSKVSKLKGKAIAEMGDGGLKRAGEAGEALLKEALEIADAAAKRKALQKIVDDFKPLEVSTKAKKELDALK